MPTTLFSFFSLSFLLTFCLTPLTILFAKKYGLVDDSKSRPHPAHTHHGIIPRAGGIPIFFGIFLSLLLAFPLNKQLVGILVGAFILVLVGIWDDKKDRSPYIRFFTNCLAVLVSVAAGVGIPYITHPFGGILPLDTWRITFDFFGNHSLIVWADLFALIWLAWTTNIIGWSGGVDGQLPGFVSISALVIGVLSFRFAATDPAQLYVSLLAFITAGAFLGFLPWNFYPQKIMPGYGGKTLAGFLLGILSILSFSKLGTALLVLAVPMTDALFMLFKRTFSGRSPVRATSEHLHHHLLRLGWGKRRIAFFYWSISAIAGVAALFLNSKQKIFIGILILVLIGGFILWVNLLRKLPQKRENEDF